jgi:hypothetical protein
MGAPERSLEQLNPGQKNVQLVFHVKQFLVAIESFT